MGEVPKYIYLLGAAAVAIVAIALLLIAMPYISSGSEADDSLVYWSGARPIAIVAMDAIADENDGTYPYLRLKNIGGKKITITKILGPGGQSISEFYNETGGAHSPLSDYLVLEPKEEAYLGSPASGKPGNWIAISVSSPNQSSSLNMLSGAASVCNPFDSINPGRMRIERFGFEYTEEFGGNPVARQQIGAKPLIIVCRHY